MHTGDTHEDGGHRLRSDLLPAMVRHDLRSSLGAMRMAASTLRDDRYRLDEAVVEHLLGVVVERCDAVMELVDHLDELARLDGGSADVRVGPVALAEVVAAALIEVADRDQRVHVNVPRHVMVAADRFWLRRALTNLITNAQRYGGDRLWIDATREDGRVVLVVTDDGPGIPRELAAEVFEAFALGPTAHEHGGTGLGLAIVRASVESMGGSVEHRWVDRGTQLRVRLVPATTDTPVPEPCYPCEEVADITTESRPHDHTSLVHRDGRSLAATLASRIARGLGTTAGACVVIAAAEHLDELRQALHAVGVDIPGASADGRLLMLEAPALLHGFWQHGVLDEVAFRAVLGSMVERAAVHGPVHVYDEMGDVLRRTGDEADALALEAAWKRLYAQHSFTLLTGYADREPVRR